MNLSASGQDLTLTSGTLDMAGFNLAVTDVLTLESGTQICRNGGVESYTTLTNNGGTISDACNAAPTVASAIADTTVSEDSSAIDNYRDLKAVFTDAEDGSGLTYTIQSNTNSGLVTPTIVTADSTLDLSFTASTTGTATITIRATDSGSSFVDDVFTVTVTDQTAPAALTTLATGTVTTASVALSWTAPGDDGATGTATTYDVRYSTSPINEANWGSAVQASGEPSPQVAGSSETFTVTGLPSPSTTYYFAIKTSDEVPNVSAISNVPSGTTSAATGSWTLENVATAVNVGSVTSYTLNFGWTATAGRLLVLTASWDKDVTSLSEYTDATTTWTQVDYRINNNMTTGAMYYKVADGTETKVRLQWTSSEDISIRVGEYSGVVSVDPLDVNSFGVNSGETKTVATGTTAATAQDEELAIAMMGSDSGNNTETGNSWSNGFTQVTYLFFGTSDPGLSVAEKDLTSTGTVQTTFTTTDTGDEMVAIVATFKLEVAAGGNNTPAVAVAIADTTVIEDSAPIDNYRDLKAVFTDAEDGSALTYTIQSNTNSGLVTPTIVAADSTLDLSFTASTSGTATITVRATDSGALFVDDVFIVTVDSGNTTPTVASAIADTTVAMDAAPIDNYRDLKAVFIDVEDGSALTYAIQSNTNSGLVTPTIVAADSTLDLSFTASTSGTATITIRATDSGASFVDDVFTVTVDGPPTVASAIADTTVSRDAAPIDNYRDLKAVFTDALDGSALTYTIQSNTNSGLVTPTIVAADSTLDLSFTASTSGTATITVRATDSGALFVDDVFTVTVNATPTVASAIPDTTVVEDNAPIDNYRDLKAVFTDVEDGSALTYTIQSNTNSGLVTPTIVAADSTLDLSFTASTSGTATITIRATDSGSLFVDDVFTVTVTDQTAPAAATTLATGTLTASSVQLSWTAPGDDGATGTATTYDVRYSTATITEGNWASATQASGEPSPQVAGSSESFTVTGLSSGTIYYFAIKTSDEVPNESAISNVPSATTSAAGINWGRDVQNSLNTTSSHSRSMGGTSPNTDGMVIDTISIYLGAQTGDVRLAVYTGGTEADPSSATLLWDAGTVHPMGTAGWHRIGHPSGGVAWPKNTVTWLAWKRDTGVAVYYSNSTADAGRFQTARGRNVNGFSANPGVAYPGTYGATGTFSGAWYSIYVVHKIEGTPPAAVTNLATGTVTTSSVALSWTAPGDDGATGTATTYDVRYSTSTITAGNWATATQATGEPAPSVAGSAETFTVTGLSESTTYYFAIKTSDEVPNESAISNVPSGTTSTVETTPPDAVTNLATGTVTTSSVALSWTAPGDDGATGTATTYDVRYSTSTINEGNWASAIQASGEPSPQVAGSSESFTVTGLSAATTYYFAIKTSDEVPNESAISNVPSGTTSASGGVTFQEGDGKLNGASDTDDARLMAASATTNYGSLDRLDIDDGGSLHEHSVIKFPSIFGGGVDQIPLGSSITSATLTLEVNNSGHDVLVYQLIEGWVEATVTWNEASTGVSAEPSSTSANTALRSR